MTAKPDEVLAAVARALPEDAEVRSEYQDFGRLWGVAAQVVRSGKKMRWSWLSVAGADGLLAATKSEVDGAVNTAKDWALRMRCAKMLETPESTPMAANMTDDERIQYLLDRRRHAVGMLEFIDEELRKRYAVTVKDSPQGQTWVRGVVTAKPEQEQE